MSLHLSLLLALILAQPEPRFIVDTANGPIGPAAIAGLGSDFSVSLAKDKVPGKDFIGLHHASLPRPGFIDANFLLLTNGDRIAFDPKSPWQLDDDRLHFTPGSPAKSSGELSVSSNYIAILWLDLPPAVADPAQFILRLAQVDRPRDVVLLPNGDRIEGTLKKLKSTGIRLEVSGAERDLPLDQVAGIAFNTELRAHPRLKSTFAHVVLSDGSRFALTQVELDDKQMLSGKPAFGGKVAVPLAEVRSLDVHQGPAVYLSDLMPQSYKHTPFLGLTWPLGKDTSAAGRPLRLAANTFDKGLGMHSQSRVDFDLAGKYSWFTATVGLDALDGKRGRVRLRVLVNGKEQDLGPPAIRTIHDAPRTVRISIAGARTLSLAVDFADFADVQAHVNWANARLIR